MRLSRLILVLVALSLSGCGIIIGQLMTAGTGVDRMEVLSGDPATLRPGAALAAIGPFAVKGEGYRVSRGDDASRLADAFSLTGLFRAEYRFLDADAEAIKAKSAAELAEGLALDAPPDYLLLGTITHRDTIVAPLKGVMMEVFWELEFFEVATGKSLILDVRAEDIYKDLPYSVAEALAGLLGHQLTENN